MTRPFVATVPGPHSGGGLFVSSRTHLSNGSLTQFLEAKGGERYAYRRFGSGPGLPLLLLQHFTGTLDNWDPALTDALAGGRELILFDNAGVGRSSGTVPPTVAGMAQHVVTFLDGVGMKTWRRSGILARRDDRPTHGARPSHDLPACDPRRHRPSRRGGGDLSLTGEEIAELDTQA